MIYVEAPDKIPDSVNHMCTTSIFLAGGISGCSNWQPIMVDMLADIKNLANEIEELIVFNPRRKNFDATNKSMSVEQIEWEYKYINDSDMISFWFPPETVCPITLFELGGQLHSDKHAQADYDYPIFVGCHELYPRKLDLEIQLGLANPKIKIANTIEELVCQIRRYLNGNS